MRVVRALVVGAVVLIGPPRADGAIQEFEAELGFELYSPAGRFVLTGVGTHDVGSSASGHLSGFTLPALALGLSSISTTNPDDPYSPVKGFQATAIGNSGGTFGPSSGTMPIFGLARFCLFDWCGNAAANITIPLSVVGHNAIHTATTLLGAHTVVGAPWTVGTVTLGAGQATVEGFVHGPASLTSSTAMASGVQRLVTPIFISVDFGGGTQVVPWSYAYLDIGFGELVINPEPNTALLLGLGVVSLSVAGRSKMRQ